MNKTTNWIIGGVLGLAGLTIGMSSFLGGQGKLQIGFITQSVSPTRGTGGNGTGTNGSGEIRYGCEVLTGSYKTCIEMQNGPFTEPSCNNSCNTNGTGTNGSGEIRYGCEIFTGSYKTCIEMQNGPFTEPSCNNSCNTNGTGTNGSGEIRYGCAIFTGSYKTCIEMQNGPFTEPSCNNSCNTPPVKYKVCTNYQCAWSDKNDGSICDTSEIGASCKPDQPTTPVKGDK